MLRTASAHLAGAIVAFGLAACTADTPDTDTAVVDSAAAIRAEVEAAGERVVAAWNGEDPAAVAALYATDAVVTTSDSTYSGREDIRLRWITPGLPVLSDLTTTNREFIVNGDMVTGTGNFTYMLTLPDSQPVQVSGTYRNTWKREGGAWVIATSDTRLAAPEAAEQ